MPETDSVRARSGRGHKERAAAALAGMGLPISDAIRLLKLGAGERRLQSDPKPLRPMTHEARAERQSNEDKAFAAFAYSMAGLRNQGD